MAHRWHFTHRCPACRQVGPPYLHGIFCGESPWPMVPPRQVLPSCRPLESLMRRPPVEQTEAIQLHPKHQCSSTLMEDWKQPTCRWRDLLAAHNNTQQPGGHSIKKALAVCIRESGLQGWFLELHNSNHLHDGLGVRAWTDTAFMDYSEGRVVQGRVRGVVAPRTSPLRSSHQTRVLDAPESYRQSILQGQMHAWHNMDQIRTRATT